VLNQILRHNDVLGVKILLHAFLSLTLDRSERLATRIDRLIPVEREVRGTFRPRDSWEIVENGKNAPVAENPDSGSLQSEVS
jgi:hypothetical protein